MLLTAILAATLCQTLEESDTFERDLSFTVELTGGGRQLGASGFVDYGVLPWLYLSGGYTLQKTAPLLAVGMSPAVPTAATHIFSGGADWTPGRHFSLSLLLSGSPKASDVVVLEAPKAFLATWRSSVGGSLVAAWASGGLSSFEWVVDAGLSITGNKLGRGVRLDGPGSAQTLGEDNLIAYRGLGGLTVTLFDRTDISLRGGLSAYSTDPLEAGRFSDDEVRVISRSLASEAKRFTTDLETLSRAAQQAATRIGQADSLSGYASAPLFAEAKIVVRHRFTARFNAQLGWTYNRYVPTAGYSNIFSSRVTFKLGQSWRLWVGGAVQLDEPIDHPAQRTADDPRPSVSGLLTVGVELTL